jgi:hypothetical protein
LNRPAPWPPYQDRDRSGQTRESHRFGRLGPSLIKLVNWLDRKLVSQIRTHPFPGAAITALAFGLAVGLNQGVRERYAPSATLLTIGLLSCGMFAFLVTAGAYLGLVRCRSPLSGARRRALHAAVSACIAVVLSLAFRNSLWRAVGSNSAAAGTGKFAALLGLTALAAFALVFGLQSWRHAYPPEGR